MNHTTVAIALKSFRLQKDMSARELSLKAGVAEYTVSRIETLKLVPDFLTMVKILQTLEVSVDKFCLSLEDPEVQMAADHFLVTQMMIKQLKRNITRNNIPLP